MIQLSMLNYIMGQWEIYQLIADMKCKTRRGSIIDQMGGE